MIKKVVTDLDQAIGDIPDGASILVGGHGPAGAPRNLLFGLLERGIKDLRIIANNAGAGDDGLASLIRARRVRRLVCSFPRTRGAVAFRQSYEEGDIELELVPQGTLSERIRAGGAGIGAFYTQVGVGTRLAEGRETRVIGGRTHLLEFPIRADFALLKAHRADRWGNLTYRKAARNYNPTMATAAEVAIVEVDEIVELGELDPEAVVTPGIFIDRVICFGRAQP